MHRAQFFTLDEALEAVRIAFGQYPCQANLLSLIWPVAFGDGAYLLHDDQRPGIWAKIPGRPKLILMKETEVKQRLVEKMRQSPPAPERLAHICSQVFGVKASAQASSSLDGAEGIRIDTDMADFSCTQCGHCCRTLNYKEGCMPADVAHWQALAREDILEWVGTIESDGRIIACRIWMVPGTNEFAETCPWLTRSPDPNRYACTIHDVRPTICRQYPGSRKHARMTGCRGV